MPARQLSNAARHAMYAQNTEEAFIVLVTISHESFTEDIRIASDSYELLPDAGQRGVVSRGLEYVYCPFSYALPVQDDTGQSRARISVDNVDRRQTQAVRNAQGAVTVTTEIVLASDVNTPEVSLPDFRLERVTYDAIELSGDLTLEYFELEPFPAKRFTPADFQGMF